MIRIACLDLEGVLIPEVWLHLAEKTGIDELRKTTRDIKIYSDLMDMRLKICLDHGLGIDDITDVASNMKPFAGAADFLNQLRQHTQIAILSDTFYEFAMPLMPQLGNPLLLCHRLNIDENGTITDYYLRQDNPKQAAVMAFKTLKYQVVAAGDSYNDLSMLKSADRGIFFRAPERIVQEVGLFEATDCYDSLLEKLIAPL